MSQDPRLTDNKALICRLHEEVWNRGDVRAVDDIYAATFVAHYPGMPQWEGPDGVRRVVAGIRRAFPDWHEDVQDVIAQRDRVVTRFISTGTHLGPFRGIAPTGRRVTVAETAVFRVAGGKVVEQWGALDTLGMLQQLGVVAAIA